jgi:hypothetical protein
LELEAISTARRIGRYRGGKGHLQRRPSNGQNSFGYLVPHRVIVRQKSSIWQINGAVALEKADFSHKSEIGSWYAVRL